MKTRHHSMVITALLLAFPLLASGQFGMGFKAGYFQSHFVDNSESETAYNYRSVTAGWLVEYAFTPRWRLESGLQYLRKGQRREAPYPRRGAVDGHFYLSQAQVPLMLKFRLQDKPNVFFDLQAGLGFGYYLNGRFDFITWYRTSFSDELRSLDVSLDFDMETEELHRFELSGRLGGSLGAQVSPKHQLQLLCLWHKGITPSFEPMETSSTWTSQRAEALELSLVFMVSLE